MEQGHDKRQHDHHQQMRQHQHQREYQMDPSEDEDERQGREQANRECSQEREHKPADIHCGVFHSAHKQCSLERLVS